MKKLLLTSAERAVDLVYVADPALRISAKREQALRDSWIENRLAATLDPDDPHIEQTAQSLRESMAKQRPRMFIKAPDNSNGARIWRVRPLSWSEHEETHAHDNDDDKILSTIRAALISIDGDEDTAKAFCADPYAPIVVPLYHVIRDLTWGNQPA
jgi:hypothetical protein